ncbi:MAG: hypothetical protein NTU41_03775 [Chloroflexi bacterium]|nr:hypothetical protein [Chloroflexota bacterium]
MKERKASSEAGYVHIIVSGLLLVVVLIGIGVLIGYAVWGK